MVGGGFTQCLPWNLSLQYPPTGRRHEALTGGAGKSKRKGETVREEASQNREREVAREDMIRYRVLLIHVHPHLDGHDQRIDDTV